MECCFLGHLSCFDDDDDDTDCIFIVFDGM